MEFSVQILMLDILKAAVLIFVAQLLRSKVKILQSLYIPSSLIAGFLGLFLGPYFLNVLNLSGNAGGYVNYLMIFVFVGIGYGFSAVKNPNKTPLRENMDVFKRILSVFNYRSIAAILVYIVPVAVVLLLFTDLPNGFGILLGGGFVGGHGTNAGFAAAITEMTGWSDAQDVGMTFSTIGLLVGLIGGIILIKIATNKKYTNFIDKFDELPAEYRTGFMDKESNENIGKQIVSPIALDPLAWSMILLLIPSGLSLIAITYVKQYVSTIPTYLLAFLFAIIIVQIFKYTNKGHLIDKKSIQRISGTATDFLIFFGISTLNMTVVITYAVPIAVLSIIGLLMIVLCTWFLAPKMMKENWFEKSMFVYGYCTGVYAIGLTLLRIVDPELKSKTLDDIAITAPINFVEYYVLLMGPALVASGKGWTFVMTMALFAVGCIVAQTIFKLWVKKPAKQS